jgi:hypothetical protein
VEAKAAMQTMGLQVLEVLVAEVVVMGRVEHLEPQDKEIMVVMPVI